MSFVIEFWKFLKVRKKFWLIPIIVVLVIFGGLIILSQGSAVAPHLHNILDTMGEFLKKEYSIKDKIYKFKTEDLSTNKVTNFYKESPFQTIKIQIIKQPY